MRARIRRTKGGVVFETLFICVALYFLGSAFLTGTHTYRFINKSERIDGSIVSMADYGFAANVEFRPSTSTVVAFEQFGLLFRHAAGDKVWVLYDPENPSLASLDNITAIWFTTVEKFILGFILLGIGLKMRTSRNL